MNKKLLVGVIFAILAGGIIYAIVGIQKANDQSIAEQKFIEQMIPHHADAIVMANLAKEKATTQPIGALAGDIISAQQKEIIDMQAWYKSWFGKEVPEAIVGQHSGGHSKEGDSLAKLQNAKDFDLEFVKQMIQHHESAIIMAQEVLPKAAHQDIIDLANAIVKTQQAEIDYMKKLQVSFEKYPPDSIGRNELNEHSDSPTPGMAQ